MSLCIDGAKWEPTDLIEEHVNPDRHADKNQLERTGEKAMPQAKSFDPVTAQRLHSMLTDHYMEPLKIH